MLDKDAHELLRVEGCAAVRAKRQPIIAAAWH